ncbi:NAD(P)/FAD-dependent oxidoreductase [Sneathiella sp.]|uniref:NAD(P)/FAD-dependent oxidoreductase n=1 Tax=Sneathiella sp. TaxID=1964365 RepID=UPI003564189A
MEIVREDASLQLYSGAGKSGSKYKMILSYYDSSAHPRPDFPALTENIAVDVCVIGGGYTGLSAALELAEKGLRVALLEAEKIGWGASGRNGGQIAAGYSPGMIDTEKIVGRADAARLWEFSVQAAQLLKERISRHRIDCDLKAGELYAATRDSHRQWLLEEQELCQQRYHYTGYRWIEAADLPDYVTTERYSGALMDDNGGHLHPLNYVLGLAAAAREAGVMIYEKTRVLAIERGARPVVSSAAGKVTADFVVLAGNAYLGGLESKLAAKIIPVSTSIIATEPLGVERARALMQTEACVADTDFNLDYFRLSADNRLLYGGRDQAGSRAGMAGDGLRANMLRTFPQLADVRIDFAWDGMVAVTRNRLPDFGRMGKNIYYAQGYSGQGVPLSSIAGKVMAEAICGEAAGFDVFARIPHKSFPGGTRFRVPLLSLAMFYYRLRDLL